jgi:hypothetical protein
MLYLLLPNLPRLSRLDQSCLSTRVSHFTGLLLMVRKVLLGTFSALLTAHSYCASCCGLTTRCGSSNNLRSSGIFYGWAAEDSKPVLHIASHPLHLDFSDVFILQSPWRLVLKSGCCREIYWRW